MLRVIRTRMFQQIPQEQTLQLIAHQVPLVLQRLQEAPLRRPADQQEVAVIHRQAAHRAHLQEVVARASLQAQVRVQAVAALAVAAEEEVVQVVAPAVQAAAVVADKKT